MHSDRTGHTAAVLADGRVLVVGGVGGNGIDFGERPTPDAELFAPASGTWSVMGTSEG
jgi:CubicO group peptidase (beta-lactamase class C family)